MLRQILQEKVISVYKLAKLSNLPYTTVNEIVLEKKNINDCKISTILAISNALNVPVKSIVSNNDFKISTSWIEAKHNSYRFNVISNNDNFEINRIHPLKQKSANIIFDIVKDDKRINKVIIFGSSTNITCNNKSDIDIMIELKKSYISKDNKNIISDNISKALDYNVDIIWKDTIKNNSNIYNNIMKGVTIYEQTTSKS